MAPAVELQDSIGVSHQDHQREGINPLMAEGTSLGGLTWRRKERDRISTGDSSHPTREGEKLRLCDLFL